MGIQPLGRFGRNQSHTSQETGMALIRCILGSLPLLSPAFRRSHFCRQVPPRPQRHESS